MINDITVVRTPSPKFAFTVGSSLTFLVSKLAAAKLAAMGVTPKMAAAHIVAKIAMLWLMLMSLIFPSRPAVSTPGGLRSGSAIASKNLKKRPVAIPAKSNPISRRLVLHSFEQEYTCVFTGKVTCGEGPCQVAQIKLRVASRNNPNIVKTTTLQPDGSYALSILLKEAQHEHLDWWISADSPESATKQVQGRQILMEDSTINIEEPISLL